MKFCVFISIILSFISIRLNAQEVISTTGKSHVIATNSIEFTLGEIAVSSLGNPIQLTEGFHQPNIIISTSEVFNDIGLLINVFPNPTTSIISVDVKNIKSCTILLFNTNGRLVFESKLIQGLNKLDLFELKSGMFLAKIYKKEELIKTLKINKVR